MKVSLLAFLLLYVGGFCVNVFAFVPVEVVNGDELIMDARNIEFLADPGGELTIQEIGELSRRNTIAWLPGQTQVLNFGVSNSVYWIRFALENRKAEGGKLFVELENPTLDDVRLYYSDLGHEDKVLYAGERLPFASRVVEARNIVFPIALPANVQHTFYLRVESTGTLFLPLLVRGEEAWYHHSRLEYTALGVFFCMLVLLALAVLLYYGVTRNLYYLYYLGYVVSIGLFSIADTGIGGQYLYPWRPLISNMLVPLASLGAVIFGVLVTRMFLKTGSHSPGLDRTLRYTVYASLAFLPLVLFGYLEVWAYAFQLLAAVVLLLAFMAATSVIVTRGRHERDISTYLYLGALMFMALGLLDRVLLEEGWLPYMAVTRWGLYIGITGQFLLFIIAMSLVVHRLRVAQEAAHEEVIGQLQALDRVKDEFLANVSHELRTPLNGIIGLSRSLLSGLNGHLSTEQSKSQTLIIQSAQRLARLVDDILDYSQLRKGSLRVEIQAVNLNHALESVIGVVKPLANKKDITLRNGLTGRTVWLRADESRLYQILYNLLGNAIKFTEGGVIEVSAVVHNGEVFVSVADTGIGIAAEEMAHIFDAFHQGDGSLVRAHAGTGLGLSITRMLVELLHGRIEVSSGQSEGSDPDSGANPGTTVTFVLPEATPEEIYECSSCGVKPAEPVFPNLPGMDVTTSSVHELRKHLEHSAPGLVTVPTDGPHTILAIDDDPINLRVLEAILLGKGLRLVTATSGRDAEALVEEEEPDLILLDLMMPGVSGYEVCSSLRQHYDAVELPIIMVTARTQTEDLVHAYDSGANDYITKPFDADELLARIYSHLHIKKLVNTLKENEQLKEEIRLRRRAEYSLQASQARLTELLDLDESAILCFDHQHRAVYFNKGACGLFGYSSADLEGLTLEKLFDKGLSRLIEQGVGIEDDPGRLHTLLDCKHRDGHSFKGDAVVNLLDVDASGGLAVVLTPYAGGHGLHALADYEALKKRDSQLGAVEQSINSILEIARSNPELLSRMAAGDPLAETDLLPMSNKQQVREQSVIVMGRVLACWEHDAGKNKIDLAEESMIWPVYIDKSTPTTRTLDKYLHLNTIPKNPRAQRVIDTAEFVLRKCSQASVQRKELEQALNNLRLILSGKSPM